MHTNNGQGNPELSNLPRKLNIGLSPSRDDFPHTHINDVGLQAVKDPESGEVCQLPPLHMIVHAPAHGHCCSCNSPFCSCSQSAACKGDGSCSMA